MIYVTKIDALCESDLIYFVRLIRRILWNFIVLMRYCSEIHSRYIRKRQLHFQESGFGKFDAQNLVEIHRVLCVEGQILGIY